MTQGALKLWRVFRNIQNWEKGIGHWVQAIPWLRLFPLTDVSSGGKFSSEPSAWTIANSWENEPVTPEVENLSSVPYYHYSAFLEPNEKLISDPLLFQFLTVKYLIF